MITVGRVASVRLAHHGRRSRAAGRVEPHPAAGHHGGIDEPAPDLRIGDREREAVDERLRRAVGAGILTLAEYEERSRRCWAARTRGDVAALTADLPPEPSPTTPVPVPPDAVAHLPPAPSTPVARPRRRRPRTLAALLLVAVAVVGGRALLAGDGSAVLGSRVVQAQAAQHDVDVGVLFGSVTVVVPDGTRARTAGTVVAGSINCDTACQAPGGDLVVHGAGGFGSVNVVTRSEYDRPDSDDD